MGFFEKMLSSIGEDWYIFVCAFVSVGCLIVIRLSNKKIDRSFELWKSENYYSNFIYKSLTLSYSVFVTLITIFPLLGMLGTVKSLLILNFIDENAILNARNSFFDALTSTAWGIIFAIIFKVVNAVISKHTDDNIEKISGLISSKAVNIDAQRPSDKRQDYEK
jgi:chemotaxis protein MotA